MSANIDIVKQSEKNLLTVPYEAVRREGRQQFVLIPNNNDRRNPHKRQYVKTGLFDGTSIEILEGLSDDTEFLIEVQTPLESRSTQKKNPFLPQRRDNRR